ncbi:family 78 glycoside hydrolase catalytic domain [Subtercola boreus]|uniref:family 78 glycoside hydrolase catalytic domain n=1 Tax=Subtercola boreus TaxID=120213 RepID=UPI003F59C4FB
METGLLDASDWSAKFVTPSTIGELEAGAPFLSNIVLLPTAPRSARLYITALGTYNARINGARVGIDELAPGWSSYSHRLKYQTHDVTNLLTAGTNRVEALIGNGWYRGQLVWPGNRSSYGAQLALLAQLHVKFDDGTELIWGTDESWSAGSSDLRYDDLYDGEIWNMKGERPGREERPDSVEVLQVDLETLVAPTGPGIRTTEILRPREVIRSPSGALIVDFGQNIAGRVRLTANGAAGTAVMVRHAEVLEHSELGTRPLRSAKATCSYVLDGSNDEILEPIFTYSGFRYAEVTGLDLEDVKRCEALVLGSNLQRTGWFSCSDPEIQRLHSNIVWSMRSNFFDVPTDCPQRDERLGWTGDAQVFAPTANFLFDTAGMLAGWLKDLTAEQRADGTVPLVVPDVLRNDTPVAGWGDAATVVPMTLFQAYADRQVLLDQYESMKRWVDKVAAVAGENHLWDTGYQLGDWLDPSAPPEHADQVKADPAVVATAYFARSASLLAAAAREIGIDDDARRYESLFYEVRKAFNKAYVDSNGTVQSDCQTVYALSICWNLLGPDALAGAAQRLGELVREAGCRISTGFLGTPLILDALCEIGERSLAFSMLTQRDCPSWLYPVSMGATTVWERWDSMLPDGSINPGAMTSFNHYAYGAVADWLHRRVAGIAPGEPGYRTVVISPQPDPRITAAGAALESPYGRIEVEWSWIDEVFKMKANTPPGVTAVITLPGASTSVTVSNGEHSFSTHYAPE